MSTRDIHPSSPILNALVYRRLQHGNERVRNHVFGRTASDGCSACKAVVEHYAAAKAAATRKAPVLARRKRLITACVLFLIVAVVVVMFLTHGGHTP